jgi:PhzF family phenazine biosynthesis protein
MKKQTVYVVDSFTTAAFGGNPAAVCVYKKSGKFDDAQQQRIAAEMNLSETCFCFPIDEKEGVYSLRWFTPSVEVPLCGHGTLAVAHVLFQRQKRPQGRHGPRPKVLRFQTLKGELVVRKDKARGMLMDFPAGRPEQQTVQLEKELRAALGLEGGRILELWQCNVTRKLLVVVDSPALITSASPDGAALVAIAFPADWVVKGVIVSAQAPAGEKYDFVSRYFAPALGILEDPVTGSAHCALAPYWCAKLGRSQLVGFQASKRGGLVGVELKGDRVVLSGSAISVMKGKLRF